MNSVSNSRSTIRDDEDVLTINAGGKLITALRGTLTIPGESMWSNLFSGRWEESVTRDEDGHIFLDFDYELIAIIVRFLRMKKIEDPSDPLLYPHVPAQEEDNFRRLLQYFGLTQFFTSRTFSPKFFVQSDDASRTFSPKFFVQSDDGDSVTTLEKGKNRIKLIYKSEDHGIYNSISCTNELVPSGDGSFWKVQINTIPPDENIWDIALGISQNLKFSDKTFCGWSHCGEFGVVNEKVSRNHRLLPREMDRYKQGDCFYFHFKSRTLSMYDVRRYKLFVINDIGDSNSPSNPSLPTSTFYIHSIFAGSGTAITLGPMNARERAVFENHEGS